MVTPLIRSKSAVGAAAVTGERISVVRRDFPEILLPDSANAGQAVSGNTDTLNAWLAFCTAAQFGGNALIFAGAVIGFRVGMSLAAAATSFLTRVGRVEIGTGLPAAPPTLIDRFRYGGAAVTSLANPGAGTAAIGLGLADVHHRMAPCELAANTDLAWRSAVLDANGNYNAALYGVGYDRTAWNIQTLGIDTDELLKGQLAVEHEFTDYASVATGAVAWTNGAWTTCNFNGNATADGDYLVFGIQVPYEMPAVGFGMHYQGDVAIGAVDSEIIQSRFACPRAGNLFWASPFHYIWPLGPFYIASGERLSCRMRASGGGPVTFDAVTFNMWKLP